MSKNRLLYLLAAAAMAGTASCSSQAAPVTLRLAISDSQQETRSEAAVLGFIEQVQSRSDGQISIEPIWNAGADTEAGFEQGVIAAVKAGEYDLGLAASRAWEEQGILAFQALQTPFLIDNDALAVAVAQSNVVSEMLDGLSAAGLRGLTLWPEDLRHPFSVVADKPFLSPEDLKGARIRTASLGITADLVRALGGTPQFEGFDYQGAESGLLQGSTLTGRPIATGNIVFFAKYQVLFANGEAFDRLSAAQRKLLLEAAQAAEADILAARTTESQAAAAWCADGGGIVMASEAQLAAFHAASQPVVDQIMESADNARFVEAIRTLKSETPASPSLEPCGGVSAAASETSAAEDWSGGPPPDGLWAVDLTIEDVIAKGVLRSNAELWAGHSSYEFRDGGGIFRGEFLDGVLIVCPFTYELVGGHVVLSYVDQGLGNYECGDEVHEFQWRLDGEGLHFNVIAIHNAPEVENKAVYEARPWQKIEAWAQGLPPEGVWQAELSAEDFVRMGLMRSVAESDWAGLYTLTFQDGNYQMVWQSNHDFSAKCQATYEVVEDVVRLSYYTDTDECEGAVEDIQWRLDDDGLHFHLVATNGTMTESRAFWEARPWEMVPNP